MRRLGIGAAMGLVASAASGCIERDPVSPSADAIVVHAVLDASQRDQYVMVQTTDGRLISQNAVAGATVTITMPDARVLVGDEIKDSTFYPRTSSDPRVTSYYRISLDRYGVALTPGATYRLHIVLPDGREVTASTTIPGSTALATFDLPATLARGAQVVLAWPRVSGAVAYDVAISSSKTSFEAFADTSIVLSGATRTSTGGVAFYPGLSHRIVVSAVDANYYDYYRRGSDIFTGAGPISRMTGAIGVFGSIVPLRTGTLIVQ